MDEGEPFSGFGPVLQWDGPAGQYGRDRFIGADFRKQCSHSFDSSRVGALERRRCFPSAGEGKKIVINFLILLADSNYTPAEF